MSTLIGLAPIATVKSQVKHNTPSEEMRSQICQLLVEPEYLPGLKGLEPGTDILVLFLFHRVQAEEIQLQLHPRHDPAKPLTGVFATRSQFRPNRIGATIANIQQVEDNVITVTGLDALDQTPILDIKPFTAYFDSATERQQLEVRLVKSLAEARQAIDALDFEIIRLLSNRAEYVRQVVNFKNRPEDVPAPARYAEVMRQRRAWAEKAALNPDVIEGMFKLLVDNFIEEELEIMRHRETQTAKLGQI